MTTTDKPLTEQTPVEIDTVLYRLYQENLSIRARRTREVESLRHIAGDKYDHYRKSWGLTYDEVIDRANRVAHDDPTYVGTRAKEALARLAEVDAAYDANKAAQRPLHEEYARRPWTRGFLVTDGHVHRSMECSTCFITTAFTWLVDLSGKDEDEIVALAGERACTVCYPTAPTLRDFEKASPLFTEEEAERNAAREQRAAEKVARDAAKIAKGLTHDGSEFVVRYTEPNAPGWERDDQGNSVHVYRDRERSEHFKTEKAAVQWVVQQMAWNQGNGRYDYQRPAWDAVIQAVATKHGKIEAVVRQEIAAKVIAKVKRDNRG